jgi:ribonuclease BN (tRNA processing enzyme)
VTFDIISTGSQGNAVIINGSILIDCGVPWKLLKSYAKQLKLVLLTHQHGDHFRPGTVRALYRERPAIRWCCCEWMVWPLLEAGVDKRVIDVAEPGAEYAYSPICAVRAESIPHNVKNCGWHISIPIHPVAPPYLECLFYATDTSTLDGVEAKDYDLYMIEANHTRAEIEARIAEKQAAGEFAYEIAAAKNHLSREQAEEWLYRNMGPNSQYVFLHQHREAGINAE